MDYYFSDDFLVESLSAAFCEPYIDVDEADQHVPLVDLFFLWEYYPSLLKIELIDWGIHQRLFVDPDELDELIHQSIFDIVSVYKHQERMTPIEFEEIYWIYGSIKEFLYEEFSETLAFEAECEREQQYLNQKN